MKDDYDIPSYIRYKEGILHIHDVPYTDLIQSFGTPCVCVSLDRIKQNIVDIQSVLDIEYPNYKIFYALKASYFQPIIEKVRSLNNVGIEVLSNLEMQIAELSGFKGEEIIFNGVGRSGGDLRGALVHGSIVNIDSVNELEDLVNSGHCGFNIGLRIHPEFKGDGNFVSKESKLGMTYQDALECLEIARVNGMRVRGISFHIFSNLIDDTDQSLAIESTVEFMNKMSEVFSLKFDYIDVGGGFHSPMFIKKDSIVNIARNISRALSQYRYGCLALYFEFGRYIVADATTVLSTVNAIKTKSEKQWTILDIGTNYLIPAMGYTFKVISTKKGSNKEEYSFVDGICSPAGFIDEGSIGKIKAGDIVAVLNTGAYTSVMKEEFVYSSPAHIFFDDNKVKKEYKKRSINEVLEFHYWEINTPAKICCQMQSSLQSQAAHKQKCRTFYIRLQSPNTHGCVLGIFIPRMFFV